MNYIEFILNTKYLHTTVLIHILSVLLL